MKNLERTTNLRKELVAKNITKITFFWHVGVNEF